MEIKLEKVKRKYKKVLYRLLQYSLFEESKTDLNEMKNNALFEYKYFNNYFKDKDRWAFFVKDQNNKLIGFVMINSYVIKEKEGKSIAEFMIIPSKRRLGVGKEVAIKCFNMFDGYFEVKPSYGSESAKAFWEKVIKEYTNNNYSFNEGLYCFSNKNNIK